MISCLESKPIQEGHSAAVAESNDCILVSDNEKHFAGMKFINPMRARA